MVSSLWDCLMISWLYMLGILENYHCWLFYGSGMMQGFRNRRINFVINIYFVYIHTSKRSWCWNWTNPWLLMTWCLLGACRASPVILRLHGQRKLQYVINSETIQTVCAAWRHQMETFSALLTICAGNSPVPGEFPSQRPVTRSFDVFFNLHLNKRLSKQS